jgi:hypothetical protein
VKIFKQSDEQVLQAAYFMMVGPELLTNEEYTGEMMEVNGASIPMGEVEGYYRRFIRLM